LIGRLSENGWPASARNRPIPAVDPQIGYDRCPGVSRRSRFGLDWQLHPISGQSDHKKIRADNVCKTRSSAVDDKKYFAIDWPFIKFAPILPFNSMRGHDGCY